jgi:uncharacterized RDD family membrane protein YckC
MEILNGLIALSILLGLAWLSIKVVRLIIKIVIWITILGLIGGAAAYYYYFAVKPASKPSKPPTVSTRPLKRG